MRIPLFEDCPFPLIVLDLEWNQQYAGQQAVLPQEIVEIGAVKVDASLRIIDTLGILVRPAIHTKMHHHVRKLTGISTSESKQGVPFLQAVVDFQAFCGDRYTLCTWGRDDLPVLWKNYEHYGLPLPRFEGAMNLQLAYDQLLSETSSSQTSLQKAMEALGVTSDLPAHRALNDALFTARVLEGMGKKLRAKPPTEEQRGQLWSAFSEQVLRLSEQKDVLQTKHRQIQDVWADEALTGCSCPLCKEKLAPKTPVLSAGNALRRQQLFACPTHGDVLTLLHAQKQRNGLFRLHKRCMLTTPERAEKVLRQWEAAPPPKVPQNRRHKGRHWHRARPKPKEE